MQGFGWYNNPTDDPVYHAHVFEYTVPELRRLLWAADLKVDQVRYADYRARYPWHKAHWHWIPRMFPHLKPGILITSRRDKAH